MSRTGVFSRSTLHARGVSDAQIRSAVRKGTLLRLRPGWFAAPEADPAAVLAVTAGGSLTCVSALPHFKADAALKGLWLPPSAGIHIRVPGNSRRATAPGPTLVTHSTGRAGTTPAGAVDSLPTAMAAASTCLPAAEWVAVADSILHAGALETELLADMVSAAPHRRRLLTELMSRTNGLSESGSESLLRHDLVQANFRVRAQVWIGRDRVDLLVGERLVVECDSVAHHTELANYVNDRLRDQRLAALGYHVLRVTYQQIVYSRPQLVDTIRELARQGAHQSGRVHRVRKAS